MKTKQQAYTLARRLPLDTPPSPSASSSGGGVISRLAVENPALVVGRKGCCMIHVARRLLQVLGVNPVVCEVGEGDEEAASVVKEMESEMAGGQKREMVFPAVFIGGRLVGGLDRLMAVHISGELVPMLKEAGALGL